nr:hypothetical protein [Leptospira interrogans]
MQHYVATIGSNIEFKRGREPLYPIKFASDSPKYSYVELTLSYRYSVFLTASPNDTGTSYI